MEFVGRTVRKEFKGFGCFTGTVKSYSPSSGLFEVVYEDGDSEELNFAEVSLLLGGGEPNLVEEEVKPSRLGRKPKKRRRVERKREIRGNSGNAAEVIFGNDSGFGGDLNKNCDLSDGSEGGLEMGQAFGGNLRESVEVDGNLNDNVNCSKGLDKTLEQQSVLNVNLNGNRVDNLKDGIDLNAEFNLNGGCDLNVDLNVGKEEISEKRDCIDLNLDASGDFAQNLNGDSLDGSTAVTHGTQRRGCYFDLNLEVNEDFKDTEGDCEEKFKVCPKFEMIEENQKKERSGDTEEKVIEDGNANETWKEVYIDITEDNPMTSVGDLIDCAAAERLNNQNSCSSGDLKADNSLGVLDTSCMKDCGLVEVLVKDSLSEARTPMIHGDSGGPNIQRSSRRKRRKLLDNLKSTTTETVLRRSTRRGSAQNHNSITSFSVSDPLSSSAVSAITEEKPVISGCEETEKPSVLPQELELPPSSEHLNLDGIPILDLFSIYACLRSFSTLLFLSPFKLEDFVAALKCKSPSSLFDYVHLAILQTLRKHLEWLANDGSESASDCLRSLNWDLLDLITWPIFMIEYFLIHGSGLKPVFDLSCFKIFKTDYYEQPASVKVEILKCLCDDLIEVEAIRSEINRRSLAAEPEIVFDRNVSYEVCKKRKAPVDIAGITYLNDEVVGDTTDWNSDECCLCKMDGSLICCDGCPAAYHSKCVGVANDLLPEGDWYCPECSIDRHKPWMKPQKSLRGAELLGIDPRGRLFFKSCGYLLVSDSCDTESKFNYYHRDDLIKVIKVLRSSDFFYGGILVEIYKHWDIPVSFNGANSNIGCSVPQDPSAFPETCAVKNETYEARKLQENSCNIGSDVSKSINLLDSMTVTASPNITSEGSAETMQVQRRSVIQYDSDRPADFLNQSDLVGKLYPEDCSLTSTSITTRKRDTSEVHCGIGYMNCYSFGQIASSVAEELTRKSSDKIKEDTIITEEEIISAQMKTILKKSSKFSGPNVGNLNLDAQKEKCGWCFSCKAPADYGDCLFIMSMGPVQDVSNSNITGFQSKRNQDGHLNDVRCQILSIHDRLQGLLLGPLLNPHHRELWRKSLLKASDLASIKHLLLMLEANLHHLALSADWLKHVDSVVTMGSASHVVTSLRAYSKNVINRKRSKCSDIEPTPTSNAASGLGMFWWRGGRLSRQVFSWKVLPRSLTSKAARQAGCSKILGILYPENSEYAKRSKSVSWQAAVEASISAEQLALQVRELDLNIRWNDIENSHPLPMLDKESRKSIKLFKKVIVRRKCSEGKVVNYLLDFGKRRGIPDIVKKHGSLLEEPFSERKKYWLDESYLPLHLLKSFEERRIAHKSSDVKSGKVIEVGRVAKRPREKKGFMYLFSKAERSEYHKCGHCNKDVLMREAVSCQYCKGFFHKRHARKSAGAVVARCKYTCHRCQNGVCAKIDTKIRKVETKGGKVQSQKCKNSQTERRSLRLKNNKKALAGGQQLRLKNSKKIPASVPLRRSPRKVKCLPLQNKKRSKRKKGKKSKSNTRTCKKPKRVTSWQKKRTQVCHSYWLNGLLLSRKPNDERAMLFRDKKLLAHSGCSPVILDQLKCPLCCEASYTSALNYISCEICRVWFHAEAFGLSSENIDKLIGFRCHMCRQRNPPVCPHLVVVKTDVSQLAEAQNDAGVDFSEEVPNTVPPLSEITCN